MPSALLLVLAAGLIAGVVLLAVWLTRARRRGIRDAVATLKVARVVAFAYGALVLIGTVVTVLQALLEDTVRLSMPVQTFWPEPLPTVRILDGPTATVTGGGFQQAEVAVSGLDLPARLLLAGAIAALCTRLLTGSRGRSASSWRACSRRRRCSP